MIEIKTSLNEFNKNLRSLIFGQKFLDKILNHRLENDNFLQKIGSNKGESSTVVVTFKKHRPELIVMYFDKRLFYVESTLVEWSKFFSGNSHDQDSYFNSLFEKELDIMREVLGEPNLYWSIPLVNKSLSQIMKTLVNAIYYINTGGTLILTQSFEDEDEICIKIHYTPFALKAEDFFTDLNHKNTSLDIWIMSKAEDIARGRNYLNLNDNFNLPF